jgi:hypothetical protein
MDLEALLDDAAVDAVAVDGDDRDLAPLLPELRDSGLLLLLPSAAPLEPDLVRAARAVPSPRTPRWPARALGARGRGTVARRSRSSARRPVQVHGARLAAGRQAAAGARRPGRELVRRGGAVVAAPAPLPAQALPGGAAVSVGAAHGIGCHRAGLARRGRAGARLSFATARLEAGPAASAGPGERSCRCCRSPRGCPHPQGSPPGSSRPPPALAAAVGGGDVPAETWPWPADLGDLLVVARVLEALRTSARTEALVPVA